MKKNKKPFFLSRVDVQVSLLTAFVTLCCTFFSSRVYHNITYRILMTNLDQRVYALYDVVQRDLNKQTFYTLNSFYDMELELFHEAQMFLLHLKDVTGVNDLYTVKKNIHGNLVYVVDGLNPEDPQFKKPGESVGALFSSELTRALMGEHITTDSVHHTTWGDIFVTYFPIYSDYGEIIGAVGIEFQAEEVMDAYSGLRYLSPFLVMISTIFSSMISFLVFRRISNPFYLDLANSDVPTGLKNRNAFEVDIHNLQSRWNSDKIGLIVIDLNQLKRVNDLYGHKRGDDFIRLVADCIMELRTLGMVAYRVGGDEFVIVVPEATEENLSTFVYDCAGMVKNQHIHPDLPCSIACGTAIYDPILDKNLQDTLERADIAMYRQKRENKKNPIS